MIKGSQVGVSFKEVKLAFKFGLLAFNAHQSRNSKPETDKLLSDSFAASFEAALGMRKNRGCRVSGHRHLLLQDP